MERRPLVADATDDADYVDSDVAPLASKKRRAARVELSIEIGIDDHTNFYVGFSENVSAGGLFIATYRLMPVDTEVALTFVLPDELPIFVHGIVRWLRDPRDVSASEVPPGMGIEFVNLGEAEQARIDAYIGTRAPLFYPGD
jgi:uncharacterized protein (TIGR02266 family)